MIVPRGQSLLGLIGAAISFMTLTLSTANAESDTHAVVDLVLHVPKSDDSHRPVMTRLLLAREPTILMDSTFALDSFFLTDTTDSTDTVATADNDKITTTTTTTTDKNTLDQHTAGYDYDDPGCSVNQCQEQFEACHQQVLRACQVSGRRRDYCKEKFTRRCRLDLSRCEYNCLGPFPPQVTADV